MIKILTILTLVLLFSGCGITETYESERFELQDYNRTMEIGILRDKVTGKEYIFTNEASIYPIESKEEDK